MSSAPPAAPSRLTVTVATVQGWPEIEPNVRTWIDAAEAGGGDVVVLDGSGGPVPPAEILGPRARWVAQPGASVFQLRVRGYREASAPLVGITEDHCLLPRDWVERSVAAHDAHPEAIAIGGSVVNGATESIMDWASFLLVQAAFVAPIESGPTERISGAVSVSYKADALRRVEDFEGLGAMDVLHQRSLVQSGATLVADDAIRVVHDQSLGFIGTVVIHFHAGRTMAGFRRQQFDARQFVRLLATPLIPFLRFARIVAITAPRGYGPELRQAAPAIWFLLIAQTAGQVIGYLAGPGDSPHKVQ